MSDAVATDIERSNSLADLAARIKNEHESVRFALKDSLRHAMAVGDLLIEAKAQLAERGQWLTWLADHCALTPRMAQRYMRVSRNRETVAAFEALNQRLANTTCVSHVTLNGALAALTIPTTAEKAVAATESSEAIADKAEVARRDVIFDAIDSNTDAIVALRERIIPADFEPGDSPAWFKKLWDELSETVANAGNEYDLAVACGDHARAFDLVSWAYDLSVDMRSLAEDIDRNASGPARGAAP
ncbi:MAG: DUF3102 domain-containing protein [Xanthobacteraceae bacterium]